MTCPRPPDNAAAPATTTGARNLAAGNGSDHEDTRPLRQRERDNVVPPRFGPFGVHSQTWWRQVSMDRRHTAVWRLAAMAYGWHRKNGHARFRRGELAARIGSVDKVTGELHPMHRNNLLTLIAHAVELDLIDKASESRCLVVNPDNVVGGGEGKPDDPCPVHNPRRRR